MAGTFGLQPLIGKSLAIVSDARFAGEHISTVVERLLCITGEDALSVERKYLGAVEMTLPTRFMFMTNELPRMNDASGALAGRFMILQLTRSFYGEEDPGLTDALMAELPGILKWAIAGLRRLRDRGHFVQPTSVRGAIRDLEDLASPVGAFVRQKCKTGKPAAGHDPHRITVGRLYIEYQAWCADEGRTAVASKQMFGRDLKAAVPGVKRRRTTDQMPFYEGISIDGHQFDVAADNVAEDE